jgi:hypothetical protein
VAGQIKPFDLFLSHAHADKGFVDDIDNWLTRVSGFSVWYDARELPASSFVASSLSEAVSKCTGMIIILSKSSVGSGWVELEANAALSERASDPGFKVVPILIEDCEIPQMLNSTKYLDLRARKLEYLSCLELIKSVYGKRFSSSKFVSRDVYVSCGWRKGEDEFLGGLCKVIGSYGYRLIGDSKDQVGFGFGERVASIMESCGAHISFLPHRGDGITSRYIIDEIAISIHKGIGTILLLDEEVDLPASVDGAAVSGSLPASFYEAVKSISRESIIRWGDVNVCAEILNDLLSDEWTTPSMPHYIFFSHRFKDVDPSLYASAKELVSGITSMPCEDGDDIFGSNIAQQITRKIQNCFVLVADVSEENINSCIEAGIGYGANRNVHLVAKDQRKRPPFMFANEQVRYYDSESDFFGILHKIFRPYRRRDISFEY